MFEPQDGQRQHYDPITPPIVDGFSKVHFWRGKLLRSEAGMLGDDLTSVAIPCLPTIEGRMINLIENRVTAKKWLPPFGDGKIIHTQPVRF